MELELLYGEMICFMKGIGYQINSMAMEGFSIQKVMFTLVNFYKDQPQVKVNFFIMMGANILALSTKIYQMDLVLNINKMVVFMRVNLKMVLSRAKQN